MSVKSPRPLDTIPVNEDGTPLPLVVSPVEGLVIKNGSTGGLAVKLPCKPTGNVVVTTAVIGDAKLSVSAGASLTFTTSNWNTPQGVTLQSVAGQAGVERVLVASSGADVPGFGPVTCHVLVS